MKLLEYGFLQNRWLWFHMLAAGVIAKLLLAFKVAPNHVFGVVLALAALWELVEWSKEYTEGFPSYGNDSSRFFLDAVGDVVGALFITFIVVL